MREYGVTGSTALLDQLLDERLDARPVARSLTAIT